MVLESFQNQITYRIPIYRNAFLRHMLLMKKGLIYATQNQTVNTLIEKLKDSITYVALTPENKVIATASVQFRKINYWYHNGDIGLLKVSIQPLFWRFEQ